MLTTDVFHLTFIYSNILEYLNEQKMPGVSRRRVCIRIGVILKR